MRKVIFGGANSLDNFIAREDGSVDWLLWSDEAAELMKDMWGRFDAMVMGRKTYDAAMANAPRSNSKKTKNPYAGMRTVVFSRTLEARHDDGLEITAEDPGEYLRRMKNEEGGDICVMGGGDLAKTLFEAGVIDEIGFNIHPVLLGGGVPLFHGMQKQIDLELVECTPFRNGCVYVLYKVRN
jgi:dihydrofolate reductase